MKFHFSTNNESNKNEINQLQMNMQQTAKLKAIDLRHDPVKAAKALFKELVKEPNRLHEASQFLYTHLPNLVDLTNKYNEINDHEIKTNRPMKTRRKRADHRPAVSFNRTRLSKIRC